MLFYTAIFGLLWLEWSGLLTLLFYTHACTSCKSSRPGLASVWCSYLIYFAILFFTVFFTVWFFVSAFLDVLLLDLLVFENTSRIRLFSQVIRFSDVAARWGIPNALERSSSGMGVGVGLRRIFCSTCRTGGWLLVRILSGCCRPAIGEK